MLAPPSIIARWWHLLPSSKLPLVTNDETITYCLREGYSAQVKLRFLLMPTPIRNYRIATFLEAPAHHGVFVMWHGLLPLANRRQNYSMLHHATALSAEPTCVSARFCAEAVYRAGVLRRRASAGHSVILSAGRYMDTTIHCCTMVGPSHQPPTASQLHADNSVSFHEWHTVHRVNCRSHAAAGAPAAPASAHRGRANATPPGAPVDRETPARE